MFWSKNSKTNKKTDKRKRHQKERNGNKKSSVGKDIGHGSSREEIQAQAMANVRAARAHIGEDTLDKIAAAMTKKQQSAMEKAKRDIAGADVDKVLDELKFMLDTRT